MRVLATDFSGKPVVKVIFSYTKVTNAGLKEPKDLKTLIGLNLMGTQVTDAGLKELTNLTSLQALYLSFTQVTDAGVKELKMALQSYSKSLPLLRRCRLKGYFMVF